MTTCDVKHTRYQPTLSEWKCPGCGSGNEFFYIDEPASSSGEACELLHDDDVLVCFKCKDRDYISGKRFAASIAKKKNLVPCPKCHGTGMVKK